MTATKVPKQRNTRYANVRFGSVQNGTGKKNVELDVAKSRQKTQ